MTARITKETTRDEFMTEAKRLRAIADEANTAFLLYLYEAERMPNVWKDSGYTFVQLIERTNLCRPSRYLKFKNARDRLGAKGIAGVGAYAVIAAGAFQELADQKEIVAEARIWEQTNGTTISEQSAQQIARDLRSRTVGVRTGHKSYVTVAKELEAAKQEIARLQAEVALLRDENAKLKAAAPVDEDTPPPAPRARRQRSVRVAA